MTTALPSDLRAAAAARVVIRSCLQEWDLAALEDDAELVVSELVGNALRHGKSPLTMTIARSEGALLLAVEDAAPTLVPSPRRADANATDGRGMLLITALSRRWGCTTGPATKIVWAELAT